MNKRSWIVVLALIILMAGALTYAFLAKDKNQPANQTSDSKTKPSSQSTPTRNTPPNADTKGVYLPYSSKAVSQATGTILLFFHAPWCPQCREIEKTINESGVPDNVTVLKVDYDANQELRQKYGVTIQTTFVKVTSQGDKLASYTAYDEPSFRAVERELLP